MNHCQSYILNGMMLCIPQIMWHPLLLTKCDLVTSSPPTIRKINPRNINPATPQNTSCTFSFMHPLGFQKQVLYLYWRSRAFPSLIFPERISPAEFSLVQFSQVDYSRDEYSRVGIFPGTRILSDSGRDICHY